MKNLIVNIFNRIHFPLRYSIESNNKISGHCATIMSNTENIEEEAGDLVCEQISTTIQLASFMAVTPHYNDDLDVEVTHL